MDAYDRCTNLAKKNLADRVAIHGPGRELFRPPTYTAMNGRDLRMGEWNNRRQWNMKVGRRRQTF